VRFRPVEASVRQPKAPIAAPGVVLVADVATEAVKHPAALTRLGASLSSTCGLSGVRGDSVVAA